MENLLTRLSSQPTAAPSTNNTELDQAIMAAEREAQAASKDIEKAIVRKESFGSAADRRRQREERKLQKQRLLSPAAARSDEGGSLPAPTPIAPIPSTKPAQVAMATLCTILLLLWYAAARSGGHEPRLESAPSPPFPPLDMSREELTACLEHRHAWFLSIEWWLTPPCLWLQRPSSG